MGRNGDEANQANALAFIAGWKVERLRCDAQRHAQVLDGAAARVRDGDVAAEDGTLQIFSFQNRLEEAETIGDDSVGVQSVHQLFYSADFIVGAQAGNEEVGGDNVGY